MTFQVDGHDFMEAIQVVRIVGSIVSMLVIGLFIWWAVRPSRRNRRRDEAIETDAADNEALWRLVDRMEARLEVLERALADQIEPPRARRPREDRIFAPADDGPDSGRTE